MSVANVTPVPLRELVQSAWFRESRRGVTCSLTHLNGVAMVGPPAGTPVAGDQARVGWVNSGTGNY